MEVQCQKCGYQWDTGSDMKMVTCPSCSRKTPRKGEEITFDSEATEPSHAPDLFTPTKLLALVFVGVLVVSTGAMMAMNGPVAQEKTGSGEAVEANMQVKVKVLKNGEPVGGGGVSSVEDAVN